MQNLCNFEELSLILVGNRIENEINSGFYNKDKILTYYSAPKRPNSR